MATKQKPSTLEDQATKNDGQKQRQLTYFSFEHCYLSREILSRIDQENVSANSICYLSKIKGGNGV